MNDIEIKPGAGWLCRKCGAYWACEHFIKNAEAMRLIAQGYLDRVAALLEASLLEGSGPGEPWGIFNAEAPPEGGVPSHW